MRRELTRCMHASPCSGRDGRFHETEHNARSPKSVGQLRADGVNRPDRRTATLCCFPQHKEFLGRTFHERFGEPIGTNQSGGSSMHEERKKAGTWKLNVTYPRKCSRNRGAIGQHFRENIVVRWKKIRVYYSTVNH